MLQFLSPIISGLALMWAVYQFYIKARDEKNEERTRFISNSIELQKAYLEKEVYELKSKFETQQKEFINMKLIVAQLTSQSKSNAESFKQSMDRFEKTLEKHDQKLEGFGKVIIKDR